MLYANLSIAIMGKTHLSEFMIFNSKFIKNFLSSKSIKTSIIPEIYYIADGDSLPINKYNFINEHPINIYSYKIKNYMIEKPVYIDFYDFLEKIDLKDANNTYDYLKKDFNNMNAIIYFIDIKTAISSVEEYNLLTCINKFSSNHNKFVIPIILKHKESTDTTKDLEKCNSIIKKINYFKHIYPNNNFYNLSLYEI